MNDEEQQQQTEAYIVRYRKTKNYKRDMARALLGKPIRAFIALRGRAARAHQEKGGMYISNPVLTDLEQEHRN